MNTKFLSLPSEKGAPMTAGAIDMGHNRPKVTADFCQVKPAAVTMGGAAGGFLGMMLGPELAMISTVTYGP